MGDPDQLHSYSYTPDVAAALITLANHRAAPGSIWHLPIAETRTTRQVIAHIYGLEEVGGTSVLHLSSVPFEQLGYVTGLPKIPLPDLTHRWLRVTPHVFGFLYGIFAALTWIVSRRARLRGHEDHTS